MVVVVVQVGWEAQGQEGQVGQGQEGQVQGARGAPPQEEEVEAQQAVHQPRAVAREVLGSSRGEGLAAAQEAVLQGPRRPVWRQVGALYQLQGCREQRQLRPLQSLLQQRLREQQKHTQHQPPPRPSSPVHPSHLPPRP